ncbi:YCF48-related protein [Melioribacter sp. Ez-97]|jgi:photosystem II stability/assembly factor-like uncharacterized protein|uniref:YCF48-related protein n=1 Tax=Melioribacter sp. Ez-97 TaxID=3423434 RepID=UPI003ED8BCE1
MSIQTKIMMIFFCMPMLIFSQWHSIELSNKNNLTDIFFLNENIGFCIGDNSMLLITEDGGKIWKTKILDNAKHQLNRITFINNEVGFIIGNGIVYRTTDQGQNWNLIFSDSLLNFIDLDFYSIEKIWLCAGMTNTETRSVIYESSDTGKTWYKILDTDEVQKLKGYRIQAVNILDENSVLILCSASIDPLGPTYIYKSTDNGVNWNYYSENFHYTWGLTNTSIDTIWAWGTGLELSIDSGKTWSSNDFKLIKEDGSIENLIVGTIIDLNISNYSKVQLLEVKDGNYSILVNKEDSNYWERINIPTVKRLNSMYFANKENIWCVGVSGTLITNNKILSSIRDYPHFDMSKNFDVLGSYPNPFNASTKIKYSVKKPSYLTLSLYDLTGQKIILFSNRYHPNGDYNFNISSEILNLSSGIYIYSLSDSRTALLNKLLLIK